MAVSMDALLRIKADVQGEGAVQGLANKLSGLAKAGDGVSTGFKGLAGTAGGLIGGLKALLPLATGAGMVALAKSAIDAADNMNDLRQKTGVGVERLSQFKQAAEMSGTTIEGVSSGLIKLAKSMNMAASNTNFGRNTELELNRALSAVRYGERTQTQTVQQQADARIELIKGESESRLTELNRRYRNERTLLSDKYSDIQDQEQNAVQDQEQADIKRIQRAYDRARKAIQADATLADGYREERLNALQDAEDRETDAVKDGYARRSKERQRQLRDAQQEEQDLMQERQDAEVKALTASTQQQIEIVKQWAEQMKENGSDAAAAFKTLGVSIQDQNGKLRNSGDVMLDIADKFKIMEDGPKKASLALKLFGKSGADLIPMLNMGGNAIKKLGITMSGDFAANADALNDKMVQMQTQVGVLGLQIGTALMPFFVATTDALIALIEGFNKLPSSIQNLIGLAAAIVIAWGPVTGVISAVVAVFTTMGPALAAAIAAFSGLLAFLSGTVLPALLAFFSGPVGWTVLAVAAVVAMCIAFREPIGKFLSWVGSAFMDGIKAVWAWTEPARNLITGFFDWYMGYVRGTFQVLWAIVDTLLIQPWVTIWNVFLRQPVTDMLGWLSGIWQNVSQAFSDYVVKPISDGWDALIQILPNAMQRAADFVQSVWTGMVEAVKGVIRGLLQSVANAVNSVGGLVNNLISAFNNLPGADIPLVPMLQVPQFAAGGVVNRPTMALIGEAGQEYVIPQSKMAQASANYLAGARGSAVLNGNNNASAPVINITTGPVVEFDGKRYVSMDDLERAMRMTAEGVIGRLRTPSARIALGVA